MRGSVVRWVDDRADEIITSLTTGEAGLQPISVDVLSEVNPRLSRALASLIDVTTKDGFSSRWPFPLGNRFVALVFEQWVQENPNPTLANQINEQACWSSTIKRLRERWGLSIRNPHDIDRVSEQLTTDIIGLLQRCRIPVTPANIGYGIAQTAGDLCEGLPDHLSRFILTREFDTHSLPARGVQLTTLAFASLTLAQQDEAGTPAGPQPVWLIQPHAQIGMTGEVAHITEPFVREHLAPALLKHRQFIQELSAHPFSDVSNLRRAQSTSFKSTLTGAETEFDYVAEARREATDKKETLRQLKPNWAFDGSIDKILSRVDKRVAQRRKRSGMPSTRPTGWRQQAKQMIRHDLGLDP
jgi:hypothetical protein